MNYHHHLPATALWGDGTFASSDGQRFPVQVKAANAGALPRYFGFGRGLSVLTSVTDHYATFGTKVIPANAREGLFALDEIFALRDRDSELAIAGHTTDTAGFTDLLFGVYDVVGLGFSPRIRDLADQRLWRLDDTALPDLMEPLMVNRVNVELIAAHWDDLLRLGASIHEGAVLPSLLLTKLQAFPRQNALARALQEHGRLVKTLFILRYLQRPEMRRRVGGQLNKVCVPRIPSAALTSKVALPAIRREDQQLCACGSCSSWSRGSPRGCGCPSARRRGRPRRS